MFAITPVRSRRNKLLLLIMLVFLGGVGCGWEEKLSFKAPDHSAVLKIRQPRFFNYSGLRLELAERGNTKTVYSANGDTFFNFAQVYWSPDSNVVAVFSCNTIFEEFAYDRRAGKRIPFDIVKKEVGESIKSFYGSKVTREPNPFKWACSNEGKENFIARFPAAEQR